jgi:hypothetical protein
MLFIPGVLQQPEVVAGQNLFNLCHVSNYEKIRILTKSK